jgi:hypothetical protein
MSSLPYISEARVYFTRPCLIQNFLKPSKIRSEYSFLTSAEKYSSYYKDNEKITKKSDSKTKLSTVSCLGMKDLGLQPLQTRTSMNSYWRSFRLPIYVKEKSGSRSDELFQLLPLIISIPNINKINANGRSMQANTFAQLFPFGICSVNMDILIKDISLKDLVELIPALTKSTIYKLNEKDKRNFKKFAFHFSQGLDECLFNESGHVGPLDMHTSIFLRTDDPLYYDAENLKLGREIALAIAALMSGAPTMSDVSSLPDEKIKDILKEKGEGTKGGEILLFNWEEGTSFIYPSPLYISAITKEKGLLIADRKIACMCNNHHSFLNVVFAINACLDYMIDNQKVMEEMKLKDLGNCFCNVFVKNALTKKKKTSYYFKTRFDPIAQEIGLSDKFKKIESICQQTT